MLEIDKNNKNNIHEHFGYGIYTRCDINFLHLPGVSTPAPTVDRRFHITALFANGEIAGWIKYVHWA